MHTTLNRKVIFLALTLGLASCAGVAMHPSSALPASCRTACVSAFGSTLGSTRDGVAGYSNCKAGCFVYAPNQYQNTYTGIQWQCVEYARRWLLVNRGMVYGDVDIAADIWNKIEYFTRISDTTKIAVTNYANGSPSAPQQGDLLIYAKEFLGTGHVAVVAEIDGGNRTLKVAEQNFSNAPWPGSYSRSIAYEERDGGVWVKDQYLLGWKRAVALH
ncbi:MAG: CHAP domain-containing protein [Pseudomonadota bacterium]